MDRREMLRASGVMLAGAATGVAASKNMVVADEPSSRIIATVKQSFVDTYNAGVRGTLGCLRMAGQDRALEPPVMRFRTVDRGKVRNNACVITWHRGSPIEDAMRMAADVGKELALRIFVDVSKLKWKYSVVTVGVVYRPPMLTICSAPGPALTPHDLKAAWFVDSFTNPVLLSLKFAKTKPSEIGMEVFEAGVLHA